MHCRAQAFGRKFFLSHFVLAIGFASYSDEASAQGYAQSELNRLKRRSTASYYSTETERQRNLGQGITRVGVAGVNRRTYSGTSALFSGGGGGKPFAGVTQGPTVSPYLSLSRPFGSATDYQTLIRPMREQQRARERQQIQNIRNQRRLNSMAARAPFNIRGDETFAPTGHSATRLNFDNFQNTGGYFPRPSPPKQQ
ncbi:MAG: hypothetical protein MK171_02910 [Pirellulales bacterium]|nr:hypothetical protein [Pirellulales bacterium]